MTSQLYAKLKLLQDGIIPVIYANVGVKFIMPVKIINPVNRQKLVFPEAVQFVGTADSNVVRVDLIADDKFPIGTANVQNGSWSIINKFTQAGKRQITAKAFDTSNTLVGTDEQTIFLVVPRNYLPPSSALPLLGNITADLATAELIERDLSGSEIILNLPKGAIYIEADMDIDSDGSPRAPEIDDFGQLETSLTYPGRSGQGRFVNAEKIPYFVLPEGFFAPLGISLGDIAAVIFKGRIEYAIFADVGPKNKIGEGSIALAESLGHDPWVNDKIQVGISRSVLYIVFPGSGDGTPQTPESVRVKGKDLLASIGGNPS